MGLGLSISSSSEGGGDFLPIIKYDARAGRWTRRDRYQDESGDWKSQNVDRSPSRGLGDVYKRQDIAGSQAGFFLAGKIIR